MRKSRIVQILAASVLLTLSLAVTSFAAMGDKEVDFGIGIATESYSGSGTGLALSMGVGYELLKISAISGGTLQVRGDIGYNRWSESEFGSDLTITRIPLSGAARLYIPVANKLRVFGEAGLEISFDSAEVAIPTVFGGGKVTADDTNVGLLLGGGIEYTVAPNVFVNGALRIHAIDNGYLNALVGVGFKF
jgi:opacity protein-like surface antigen